MSVVENARPRPLEVGKLPPMILGKTRLTPQFGPAQAERAARVLDELVETSRQTGVLSQVMVVSPEMAWVLLGRNPNNRNVIQDSIRDMVSDISAGRYSLNGETIVVSDTGELNDGQHRCIAIVLTNTPIKSVVVVGVPRESRMTVGTGHVRTTGNFLAMQGVANGTSAASVSNLLMQWQQTKTVTSSSHSRPSKAAILEFFQSYSDVIQAAIRKAATGPAVLVGAKVNF